ncbi:MAG: diguanylate cyclase [Proteobacteria bacterium]|nr:diguanylate cyclase [Pseudomonadota bacterium]
MLKFYKELKVKRSGVIVENQIVKISENVKVQYTISLGVDCFDLSTDSKIDDALNRADKALYEAKENGRNRVC